ncbi:MAG: GMC family oxidoreductase [Chloroflexi bacterium]|nr:GMC family oxidoreductase [Chloroflexota bacterium]
MNIFDFVIIGSGFGGSVSAMRLTEKGYSVLVLERGKRFRDEDFATTNWLVWKYLWLPAARCFGILQISPFRDVFALHGSGVGGGSLGYANVLMEPEEKLFDEPAWKKFADWKTILRPHYATARKMLGVARNPRLWAADAALQQIAQELKTESTFQATDVGVFFGEEGKEVPDPFFGGEGPARVGCIHCGGCMVGCRYNAKNTLVKNYLYFAEKRGAQIWAECDVQDIRPLESTSPTLLRGARYEVVYRKSTSWFNKTEKRIRARNVILSAGALGTMKLLFHCRDVTRSLPNISARLGEMVRTNSEELLGVINRTLDTDYSKGVAITSIFHADDVTRIEPVRYSAGSDLMRFLGAPLISTEANIAQRLLKSLWEIVTHPIDTLKAWVIPGWAIRTTIMLVMQTEDNRLKMRLGRSLFTLFSKGLVSQPDEEANIPMKIDLAHRVTRSFAEKTNGIPSGSTNETLLKIPITAHILGGIPMGNDSSEGVVNSKMQIHNYEGLYAIDGSIIPANPGVNPSLTITAFAEYAMSHIADKTSEVSQTSEV